MELSFRSSLCLCDYVSMIITLMVPMFLTLFFLWLIKSNRKLTAPQPPGPYGLPFLGYLPFLGTDIHRNLTKLANIYGPIFKVPLGNHSWVVISSPELVKVVVRDLDTTFSNHEVTIAFSVITYGASDISMLPYGPEWRKLRKIFTREIVSNASLDDCYYLRKQAVSESINYVFDKAGYALDIGELTFSIAIRAIMNVLLGRTLAENHSETWRKFRKVAKELIVTAGNHNISDAFPVLAMFDLQGVERRAKKIHSCIDEILNFVIELNKNPKAVKKEGHGNEKNGRDFLQILFEFVDHEDSDRSITLTQLKGLLLDIILGGTETISTMSEWIIAELIKHPNIMKDVQNELAEVIGMDNAVEEAQLPKLHYLDAVVKETLRLHPALPFLLARYPSQTCTVGGYTIDTGDKILLNAWAIHRDPSLWEDPLEFQPKRFLNDSQNVNFQGNTFRFFPFGLGRRICPGIPLAERMLMYVTASLLHYFDWKLPDGAEVELSERFAISLKKKTPLLAIPTPRVTKEVAVDKSCITRSN